MKILQIVGGVDEAWGGPSKVVVELSAELARRGHDVEIVTTNVAAGYARLPVPLSVPLEAAGGYRLRYHRADLAGPPFLSVGQLVDVWRRARDFDIAHVHGLFNAPVSGAQAILRALGVPYVVRACGMLDPYSLAQRGRLKAAYYRVLERPNLEGAERIHVSTRLEAEAAAALGLTTPIAIIPQGVDPAGTPDLARPHPRPYLLFLSRVARKKGLLLLIDAFAAMAARWPELDLVIAGPDEHGHLARVQERAAARGLAARVRFTGMVRGVEKATWLGHAEAFALPSDDENFGVVVVEAVQLGVPVVVSDQVGLADAVAEHGAGEVVPRDEAALVAALERVLERGRPAYAAACAAMAERFRWESAARRVEALYVEVLAARAASGGGGARAAEPR